ncbi:uncharacterized protein LOC102802283 [Saccoglossus kowalevskii]
MLFFHHSCPEEGCGKTFAWRENIKTHLKRSHKVENYKCEYEGCGKLFKKRQHLKTHQYEHTDVKPYKCEYPGCNARFIFPSVLKRHCKIHDGYPCTKEGCMQKFEKWSLLRKHVSQHEEVFKCEKCDKTFTKKVKLQSLLLHIRNYHEGQRPYACSHEGCTKTFQHKISMVKHQIVHDPTRPPKEKPKRKPRKSRKLSLAAKLSGYRPTVVKTSVFSAINGKEKTIPNIEGECVPMEGLDSGIPGGVKTECETCDDIHVQISQSNESGNNQVKTDNNDNALTTSTQMVQIQNCVLAEDNHRRI